MEQTIKQNNGWTMRKALSQAKDRIKLEGSGASWQWAKNFKIIQR